MRLSRASCYPTAAVVALTARSLAAFTAGSSPGICYLPCQNHIESFSAVCAASRCSVLENHAHASVKVTPSAVTTLRIPTSTLCTAVWHLSVQSRCSPHHTHSPVGLVSAMMGLSATHLPTSVPRTTGVATSLHVAYSIYTMGQLFTMW